MSTERFVSYWDILGSPWWRARKAALIRYRGERCERCGVGRGGDLQMHHRTYERIGRELPEDVELLCRRCHRLEHGIEHDRPDTVPWSDPRIDIQRIDADGELDRFR